MENLNITVQLPTELPATVSTPADERLVAEALASVQDALDQIERKRTEITKPQRDALTAINDQAKETAYPYEKMREALAKRLTEWRGSAEGKRLLAERSAMEWRFKEAQREGAVEDITKAAEDYSVALELAPKSVPAGAYRSIRYRRNVVIDGYVFEEIPYEYIKATVDEVKLKKALADGVYVPSVTWHEEMMPSVYSVDSNED